MRKIVVGIDGSEDASAAMHWAANEARDHRASLTVLLAWDFLGQPGESFSPGFDQSDALDALNGWVEAADLSVEVDRKVVCDLPVSALVDASASADLVVLGSRGRGGFKGLLLGSVSSAVAERALCPVAVVRSAAHPRGPVVVGVDGSVHAHRSLQWAIDEARAHDVPLELVHAWSGGAAPIFGTTLSIPRPHAQETAEHDLADAMATLDVSGVVVHRHVAEGTPAGVLVNLSRTASVVVVGSRGRGGLTSILLGSTSRHLLHHAEAPVVVIR